MFVKCACSLSLTVTLALMLRVECIDLHRYVSVKCVFGEETVKIDGEMSGLLRLRREQTTRARGRGPLEKQGTPLNAGNSQPTLLAYDLCGQNKTSSAQDPSQVLLQVSVDAERYMLG